MWKVAVVTLLACSACGVAPQPKSARTTAAFEVPLSTAADRDQFLVLLRKDAKAAGFHVDAASADQLKQLSDVWPLTINATVWRGDDDDEAIASVMDGPDHRGLAWLAFSESQEPKRTARFRDSVMKRIMFRWPQTRALPIMPTGAIPLPEDLLLTKDGYRVKGAAAPKYGLAGSSPHAAGGSRASGRPARQMSNPAPLDSVR